MHWRFIRRPSSISLWVRRSTCTGVRHGIRHRWHAFACGVRVPRPPFPKRKVTMTKKTKTTKKGTLKKRRKTEVRNKKASPKKRKTARPVVPTQLEPTSTLKLVGTDSSQGNPRWSVTKVWTAKLGKPFTPVSCYFLDNYHRLKYPITPTELAFILHLLRYKWDEAMPFPAMKTIATKIGRSEQAVRTAARNLESKGYLVRHMKRGSPNHFDLRPLFVAVEKLFDDDEGAKAPKRRRSRNLSNSAG